MSGSSSSSAGSYSDDDSGYTSVTTMSGSDEPFRVRDPAELEDKPSKASKSSKEDDKKDKGGKQGDDKSNTSKDKSKGKDKGGAKEKEKGKGKGKGKDKGEKEKELIDLSTRAKFATFVKAFPSPVPPKYLPPTARKGFQYMINGVVMQLGRDPTRFPTAAAACAAVAENQKWKSLVVPSEHYFCEVLSHHLATVKGALLQALTNHINKEYFRTKYTEEQLENLNTAREKFINKKRRKKYNNKEKKAGTAGAGKDAEQPATKRPRTRSSSK